MRKLFLFSFVLIIIGGLYGNAVWQGPRTVQARGSQGETPTDTPTPSQTPEVTDTPTATLTPTVTTTPDFQYVATLSSGRSVAIQYTVSAGEALIAVLEMILIGLVIFGLFLALVNRQ